MDENEKWKQYNEKTKNIPPRDMMLKAFKLFKGYKGTAIDIGCGAGNDCSFLLMNGWNVIAVDKNKSGLDSLKKRHSQIKVLNIPFEKITVLPKCDLLTANYSIHLCNPSIFDVFINALLEAINMGGRFAGNFFGTNDSWYKSEKMTFLDTEKVKLLFDNFDIEYFNESEFDGKTASGKEKHWHVIDVIARKVN